MKTISLRRNRLELKLSFSHLHIVGEPCWDSVFSSLKWRCLLLTSLGLSVLFGFFVGGGRFWLVGGRSEIIQVKGYMCWVLIEGKAIVSTQRATAPC